MGSDDQLRSAISNVLPVKQNKEPAAKFENPWGTLALAWVKQAIGPDWNEGEFGSVIQTLVMTPGFGADE